MALRAQSFDLNRAYTVEEFELLPEFGNRYDLLDGRLVKRPVPGGEHSYIIDIIRDAIKFFDPKHQLGYSLQETSVRLGPKNAPTPDISYWKAERQVKITAKAGPRPDLAVEVHSPSDLQSAGALASAMLKVEKLIEGGVPIVWVVYPNRRTVEVYHAGRPYQSGPAHILSLADSLDGEDVIPGFKLAVAALFEKESTYQTQ
jgi:Uma2 family endonuclease